MCLILFAIDSHPKYSLVVAANRDEFYKRPTDDAAFWTDHPHVLAGRDLSAGGTWMGVNRMGKIAMLTNYRDMSSIRETAPSRGHLVADFLISKKKDQNQYFRDLKIKSNEYNGFNILAGSRSQLSYYNNIDHQVKSLSAGIYGISNHLLDTPWSKVKRGKEKLEKIVKAQEDIDPEMLFEALYDDIKAPDELLPDTGIGLEKERMLSSMFIKSPEYGSRSSTVVLVTREGFWSFFERAYDIKDFSYRTGKFEFKEEVSEGAYIDGK